MSGVGVSLNGAPFASVFLIVAALLLGSVGPSVGLRTEIAVPQVRGLCGDSDRLLVVQVAGNGHLQLNGQALNLTQLAGRLKQAFLNRGERAVFLLPDKDSTYEQVAAVIDVAVLEADHVALLSHSVAQHPGDCGPLLPVPLPSRDPGSGFDYVRFLPWYSIL